MWLLGGGNPDDTDRLPDEAIRVSNDVLVHAGDRSDLLFDGHLDYSGTKEECARDTNSIRAKIKIKQMILNY